MTAKLDMHRLRHLNLNSVLIILIGIGCVIAGVLLGLRKEYRILGGGLFITGIGNLLFGATDGFSDQTPHGRLLFRVGAIAYLVGFPILVYGMFKVFGGE